MKKHDWKVIHADAGAGIGEYEYFKCEGCGGSGGCPDEDDRMSFDRRTWPFFTLGSEQIKLDLDCDIAKAQIEELKLRSGNAKPPAIRFLPEAFVEAARALGADTVKVTFASKAAVIGAGVPAEVANLLDIYGMDVWVKIEDGTRQVHVTSHDDFSAHGFAIGYHSDVEALVEGLRFVIQHRVVWRPDTGEWAREELEAAIRLLGEEP